MTTTARTSVGELAKILAERRSAATAGIVLKVSAQGALQPEVSVGPDTTREDVERMTELALWSVQTIMASAPAHSGPPPAAVAAGARKRAAKE